MDKLYSPWRSLYIQSFKDKKEDAGCVFCNCDFDNYLEDESQVVFIGDKCFIMLNLFPYNSGHLMVIPKRHLNNIHNLTDEESFEIMKLTKLCIKALDMTMKPQGYNIGANLGKAAGAGIDQHLHYHIVPRWIGDINFMPVIGEVKVISKDLIETKRELIIAFNKLINE
ncbi:MAG TPA: HIT domain-containing protein [Melioribacteraceae bacterium]|nr:HIT domain-containing protein [Melioribacteraceae bacterium]